MARAHRISTASAIAPDTRGGNFFDADRALSDLLSALPRRRPLLAHLEPHLMRLGELAANELDEAARLADRHPPVLHPRDDFGRDRQWIEYHPAYRRLEAVAFGELGMHAMSHRAGVLGWPRHCRRLRSTRSRCSSTKPSSVSVVRSTSPIRPHI